MSGARMRCPKCRGRSITIAEEVVTLGDLIYEGGRFVASILGEAEWQPSGRYFASCRGSANALECRHRWRPRRALVDEAFRIKEESESGEVP